jgi:type IV pilus assembly protein PilY1
MGYTISGTTEDGTYLVVQDDASNILYFADTPAGVTSGGCRNAPYCATRPSAPQALPHSDSRLFTPGASNAATLLKDPLWYAAKWGGFNDTNANNRPDLPAEWDENNDGNPDNYFLVTNALTLGAELRNAFNTIIQKTASAAAVATNTTRLDTNTLIYQAQFRSDDWTGHLLAYQLDPTTGAVGALAWDAASVLPPHGQRKIFTRAPAIAGPGAGDGVPFEWDELGALHQAALNLRPDLVADGNGALRVAWLRGDHAQEQQANGSFRNRSVKLGDIINSDPQFVGAQNFGYEQLPTGTPGADSYQTFRQSKIDVDGVDNPNVVGDEDGRPLQPMVYVGANDGMLHAFDAATGVEQFAYVPSTLIPELNQLADPSYSHRYFVDGQIVVGDAFIDRGGTTKWATVLVGTTGAGGKTVFALDVTRPHAFAKTDVMWEFTDADLGNPIGQPVVARMADGTWAAVFGNGYNSTNQQAYLYVVRLQDGTLLRKIPTGVGSLATPNGLATPSLLADGARTIRAAYAGDLHGNLWKFDLSNAAPALWGAAFSGAGCGISPNPACTPFFKAIDSACVAQPISAAPEIGRHPQGGYMIYFGTGKFFETNDNIVGPTPQAQTFYGLWDKAISPSAISVTAATRTTVLTQQTILYEGKPANSQFNVRVTSDNPTNWAAKRGWFMDLVSPSAGAQGERVVSLPLLRNGRVIFPTLIPSANPCEFGGGSWLMELEAVSGERLEQAPLDIDEDGDIDANDLVTVSIGGTTVTVAPSAIQSREGIIDTPAVVTTPDGNEIKVASGTTGNVEAVRELGSGQRLRGSWRQLR